MEENIKTCRDASARFSTCQEWQIFLRTTAGCSDVTRSAVGRKLKPGWVRTCCCDASGAFGFTSPGTASRALAAPAALNSSSVAQPLKATIPQARKAKYHLFTAG